MRSSRDIASSLPALAAAVVLNRCSRTQEPKAQAAAGAPPAPVVAQKVEAQDIPAVYEYVGQTAGSSEVEVRARVSGILLKRNFTEGGAVKQGQSLFNLDADSFHAALPGAEAEVASAEARHAHFADERRSLASAQSSLFHALGGGWRPDADRLGALGRADRVWPTQSL